MSSTKTMWISHLDNSICFNITDGMTRKELEAIIVGKFDIINDEVVGLYDDSTNTLYPLSMAWFSGLKFLLEKTFKLVLGSSDVQALFIHQDTGDGLDIDFNRIVGFIRTLKGPVLTHHQFADLLGKVMQNNGSCQGIMWNIFDSLSSSATKVPLSEFVVSCAILCRTPDIANKFSLLVDLFIGKPDRPTCEEVKKVIACVENCAGLLLHAEPKAANRPYVWGCFCGLLRVWLASLSENYEIKKDELMNLFEKMAFEMKLEETQFHLDCDKTARGTGFGKLACDGAPGNVTHWNNRVPDNASRHNSPPQRSSQVKFGDFKGDRKMFLDARNSIQNTQYQLNTARDNLYNPINDIVNSVHNLPFVKGLPRPMPPITNKHMVDESQVYQEYAQDTGNTVVVLSYSSGGRPPSRRARRHRLLEMNPYTLSQTASN